MLININASRKIWEPHMDWYRSITGQEAMRITWGSYTLPWDDRRLHATAEWRSKSAVHIQEKQHHPKTALGWHKPIRLALESCKCALQHSCASSHAGLRWECMLARRDQIQSLHHPGKVDLHWPRVGSTGSWGDPFVLQPPTMLLWIVGLPLPAQDRIGL